MNRMTCLLIGIATAGLVGCSSGTSGTPHSTTPPAGTAHRGDTAAPGLPTQPALPSLPSAAGANSGTGVCGAFTDAEISGYAGQAASAGEVSGPLNTACTWDTAGNGNVMIQIVPEDYWEPHNTTGHRALKGIGDEAFVEGDMFGDGWVAVAKDEHKVIYVDIGGAAATADRAVALLTEAVQRLP